MIPTHLARSFRNELINMGALNLQDDEKLTYKIEGLENAGPGNWRNNRAGFKPDRALFGKNVGAPPSHKFSDIIVQKLR